MLHGLQTKETILGPKLDLYDRLGCPWVTGHGPKYFPSAVALSQLTDGDVDRFLRRHYSREWLENFGTELERRKRNTRDLTARHKLGWVVDHSLVPDLLIHALEHDFPLDFRIAAGCSMNTRTKNIEKYLDRFMLTKVAR